MRSGWPVGLRGAAVALMAAGSLLFGAAQVRAQAAGVSRDAGLEHWVRSAVTDLSALSAATDAELRLSGTQRLLRIYLDSYEPLESWYGPGAPHGREPLAGLVAEGEREFHTVLRAREPGALRTGVEALRARMESIGAAAAESGVPVVPDASQMAPAAAPGSVEAEALRTDEIRSIVLALRSAASAYGEGRPAAALSAVEATYLGEIEPVEPRLPGPVAREIESLIHLRLRPAIARHAPREEVGSVFASLEASLARADAALAGGSSFWFGAVNAFVILVREGLEAVLLIAAILAYLTGVGAGRRDRRWIWIGATAGIAGSFATWGLARTLLPVSGAGRELLEGVTALVAVAVLLYVSHWLFQKTYLQDWKEYLRANVGRAVSTGSAFAMASLAFAAVYREGFETVLFYQALLFDTSSGAVLAGFLPGVVLIAAIGTMVLKLGGRLPLRQLFAVTNTILLYLAFVFLGKGIYNLQEAGVFTPHPIGWIPDSEALRLVLGVYPLAETLLAQFAFLLFLAGASVVYSRRTVRRPAPSAAPPARVPVEAR